MASPKPVQPDTINEYSYRYSLNQIAHHTKPTQDSGSSLAVDVAVRLFLNTGVTGLMPRIKLDR
jgi:hypothetical protein